MLMQNNDRSFAIVNDSKYSCSAADGEMRMVIARSCYYCDSSAIRHDGMRLQDIGEQTFRYVIAPNARSRTEITHTAQELNTEWVMIPETYHQGKLPQKYQHWHCDRPNISILAWKQAEDGNGSILRIQENADQQTSCTVTIGEHAFPLTFSPNQIQSFRITPDKISACDFLEWNI
jgi:alpha-mannosidase